MRRTCMSAGSGPLLAVLLTLALSLGCAGRTERGGEPVTALPVEVRAEPELGIEIVALRLSSGGYMLDFRYRAVDPERADVIFNREQKPYLIHEGTGARFLIPAPAKVGPLRQMTNRPVAGKTYFMMFANPGRYVKAGDLVTVVVGEHRIEHLRVE